MSDMDHNSQIDETQIFRLAMQDAEDESLETLEAAADIFDQLMNPLRTPRPRVDAHIRDGPPGGRRMAGPIRSLVCDPPAKRI